jgi:hypothetical protein
VVFAALLIALAAGVLFAALARNGHGPGGKKAGALPTATATTPSSPSASATPTPDPDLRTPSPIPGYLMIADRGNNRALLVDSHKHILWRYPRPGTTPAIPFYYDDDVFFGLQYTRIISNQEDQQTIQVISFPQGRLLWHYGHVGVKGGSPGFLNTPDDAYLLPDGTRTVADVYNCRVLFISPAGKIVRQIGTTGVCSHDPPRSLAAPNGDTPMPGGAILVTEITGSWIDAFGPRGNLLWSVHAPVAYPSDAQWLGHGKILLTDYSHPGHILIMTTGGRVLWKYGPASGPGELDHPSLALPLPNGLIAVNDDFRDRVVLIDPHKHRIVWQYGHTNVPGTAPGYLHIPDGMDLLPFGVAMRSPAIRRVVLRP